MTNFLFSTDSYKMSHYAQYPKGTTRVNSYIEARGGSDEIVFFGMQGYIRDYLICRADELLSSDISTAARFCKLHGVPFNWDSWNKLKQRLFRGEGLPIEIYSVDEGTVLPAGNVLVQIRNTDPEFFWLTSWLETQLLRAIWYPTTVATQSREMKEIIRMYLEETTGSREGLEFMLQDFGARGVSSSESAGIGGAAHLVNFLGSDTMEGAAWAMKHYGAPEDGSCISYSVAASEHSTMTSWGKENEVAACANMLDQFGTGIVSVVSDSYDIYACVDNIWGGELKDAVNELSERGGRLVVRPDCYDDQTEIYTEDGWVLFENLNGQKVAQISDDEFIEFVEPIKVVSEDYYGEMIRFKDGKGKLDLLVTPNHRMVYKDKDSGEWRVQDAETSTWYYNKQIIRSAEISNSGWADLSPHQRLLIAFQADGSFPSKGASKRPINNYMSIRFNFSKARKLTRLIGIVQDCGYEYSVHQEKARPTQKTIYIKVPLNKTVSKEFDWVSPRTRTSNWCRDFIEELSYWDATRRSTTRFKFDTTNQAVSTVVQEVSLLAGYGCTTTRFVDNRSDKFSDVFSSSILTRNNTVGGQTVTKATEEYSGRIYCVTVPTGRILVRRNGCTTVCGNSGDVLTVPIEVCESLMDSFGYTTNEQGFRVLPDHVRVLQGDGLNKESLEDLCCAIMKQGIALSNFVFGMGGGLLQGVTRDTYKFAMKASAVEIDGVWEDIYKDPIHGGKKSKKGILGLYKDSDGYCTLRKGDHWPLPDLLKLRYKDGEIFNTTTFDEIRERAR
ncbi:MAG: nicotinamide phosphoribosyltransferase domain-containing protein [Nitrosopumilus sp.]